MENKTALPLQKNDEITLTIDALGSEGQGIGRVDGYAVFVPGALVGEAIRAHVIKTSPNYAVAKLIELQESAKDRVSPPCAHFPACGGCSLQHLSYGAQLSHKKQVVSDALRRIGHLTDFELFDTLGMDEPSAYRNKGSFPYGLAEGAVAFGFFAPRSHRLVPLEGCMIQHPAVIQVARCVRDWARENHVSVYDEQTHMGSLRHCMARANKDGRVMAVIVTHGKLPHKDALIDALQKGVPNLASIYHNRNDKRTNVIFGERYELLWGERELIDEIGGLRFSVSPASFLQVNPEQTERLYKAALEYLDLSADETIADVYCGIGTISLLAAKLCKKVLGIENVAAAVEDAKKNAALNGITNADFLCGDAESVLPALIKDGLRPDKLVVDPPRKGCESAALEAMASCGAERIVYVSCNPATLARDCAYLAAHGYKLEKAQPVDMFPYTSHVETVCLLSKKP